MSTLMLRGGICAAGLVYVSNHGLPWRACGVRTLGFVWFSGGGSRSWAGIASSRQAQGRTYEDCKMKSKPKDCVEA